MTKITKTEQDKDKVKSIKKEKKFIKNKLYKFSHILYKFDQKNKGAESFDLVIDSNGKEIYRLELKGNQVFQNYSLLNEALEELNDQEKNLESLSFSLDNGDIIDLFSIIVSGYETERYNTIFYNIYHQWKKNQDLILVKMKMYFSKSLAIQLMYLTIISLGFSISTIILVILKVI